MASFNNTILVTGGAGYIGSHTCKALFKAGYNPVTFDNLIYGHREAVKWGKLLKGDLLNMKSILKAIHIYRPIAVLHFAAFAYVGESVLNPSKYYKNNVIGSINLLEAMRITGINKIIFSSTCATYGIPDKIPITEDNIQIPINPYGKTKFTVEKMLNDYDTAYGIQNVSLRYFNAAGADPDCEIGENHNPETHLIPIALDAAVGRREKFVIFGNDYNTPDGTCIRDYIHVSDLADAHLLALRYLLDGASSDYFNLGTGMGYSVIDIINTIKRITGKSFVTVFDQRREGDPPSLLSASNKANEKLGWNPQYSDIDSIIKTAWNWHKYFISGE